MQERITDVEAERAVVMAWPVSAESMDRTLERLTQLAQLAAEQGGYVKKIVWDEAEGYPPHSWGFVQYTVRPYQIGYGCDGTTDRNIHLLASHLCDELGVDSAEVYAEAYCDDTSLEQSRAHLDFLLKDETTRAETALPETITPEVIDGVCDDLYSINNRSFEALLRPLLHERYQALHAAHTGPRP